MASLKKRVTDGGAVRYDVRYRLPDGVTARRKAFTTHKDAQAFYRVKQAEENAGQVVDHRLGDEPFGTYAARWVDTRLVRGQPIAPLTRAGYLGLLSRNLLQHLEHTSLRQIRPNTVRAVHAAITEAAGASQAAKSYTLLRAILNTAAADELIGANPCRIRGAGVERPDERPIISTEMVLDLADSITPRYRALVLLAGIGALRTGELLGLRRRDVDLLHGHVDVVLQAQEIRGQGRVLRAPKSDAGRRRVNIPRQVVEVLDEHLATYAEAGPDGAVFTGPEGNPLSRTVLSKAWKDARTAAGAPDGLHVHDLRHHGATATATARMPGMTMKELMARIGHSSPRAALIYQHATEERDRQVATYLEAQLEAVERTPVEAPVDLPCHPRVNEGETPRRRRKPRAV